MLKRVAVFMAISVAVLLASKAITNLLLTRAYASVPKPFTAQVQERRYGENGDLVDLDISTYARKSDGASVTLYQLEDPNGKKNTTRVIDDLSLKKRIAVKGLTESLSTTELSEKQIEFEKQKLINCAVNNTGETRLFLGLRTYRCQIPMIGGSLEYWAAPDLGCYPLKLEGVKQRTDGSGRQAVTIREVLQFTIGEPDPSLFAIPSWVEMDPITESAEFERRYGKVPFSEKALRKLQALYVLKH